MTPIKGPSPFEFHSDFSLRNLDLSHGHLGPRRSHGPGWRAFRQRRSFLLLQEDQALRDQEVERRSPLGLG
jgi:hypothetical protein